MFTMLKTYRVERVRAIPNAGPKTLLFMLRTGQRPWAKFFWTDQVPEFDGEKARFGVDRSKGRWRFVRQVEMP